MKQDSHILLWTRCARLFAYGLLSVVLVLYLTGLGLSESQTGLLFTLTLAGDTAISLMLTTRADRLGRKRMLIAGAVLMAAAGFVFASTGSFLLLLIAGTFGVISPSGNEVGPFLPIEQASLAHIVSAQKRTGIFARYALAGSLATAAGALAGGALTQALGGDARGAVMVYGAMGAILAVLFSRLSRAIEVSGPAPDVAFGVSRSKAVVTKLSALFALDAFGGGFVVQTFAAYWFHLRWGVNASTLGAIFFGANLLAAVSALLASRLAARIGLIRTMVFTHLPSNILLILVPLMPNLPLAILVLLLRFSISQMDVPARQSYTMAVVPPEERSAVAGITGVVRTAGAAMAPVFAGMLFEMPAWIDAPFYIAGALKIAYDLLLYRAFISQTTDEPLDRF